MITEGCLVAFSDRGQRAEGVVIEVRNEGGSDVLVIEERQSNGTKLRFQRFAVACELLAVPIARRP